MPFLHDETNVDWPEGVSEPPPPRADEFMYVTAARIGVNRLRAKFLSGFPSCHTALPTSRSASRLRTAYVNGSCCRSSECSSSSR